MNDILDKAKENMLAKDVMLSEYACKYSEAILLKEDKENKEDIRPIFFRDIDRIIHSSAYTRYIDKTQVFSFIENDHITHRVLHVQLVSKIARTIARSLRLNEDLAEAISLGHDVGHTPFGHTGENFLNNICKRENIGLFYHNAQGVRVFKDLGSTNISLQTLDGMLAHNGEILLNKYEVDKAKDVNQFLEELDNVFNIEGYSKTIKPMTLEASVARLSDIIAYIGRDIEDAILLGVIERKDIPASIIKVLGDNNSKIVDTLIKDILINSFDKPYLCFSREVFESLIKLKKWSYEKIYLSKEAKKNHEIIEDLFNKLFYCYLEKLNNVDYISKNFQIDNLSYSDTFLYKSLAGETKEYLEKTDIRRIIVDYIAGQTDRFFLKECEANIKGFKSEILYK